MPPQISQNINRENNGHVSTTFWNGRFCPHHFLKAQFVQNVLKNSLHWGMLADKWELFALRKQKMQCKYRRNKCTLSKTNPQCSVVGYCYHWADMDRCCLQKISALFDWCGVVAGCDAYRWITCLLVLDYLCGRRCAF